MRLAPEALTVAPRQFETLRLHLVKLAATIVEKKTRIIVTLPASCPRQGLLRFLFDTLAPPRPA